MATHSADIILDIANYYAKKLTLHGETARGVDWNSEASQNIRFMQLCKILPSETSFSVNDLGCGYGALLEYLAPSQHKGMQYRGYDISQEMVEAARKRHQGRTEASFEVASYPLAVSDYGIASGILNVRLHHSESEWLEYIESTIEHLDRTSTKGFAFNCLTSYSDRTHMKDYLYYADPCALLDLCKRKYSRNVALLHDYDLYEFTILVRKSI